MTRQANVALFVGSDISSHVVMCCAVKALHAKGVRPVLIYPKHAARASATVPPAMAEMGYYERRFFPEIVFPLIEAAPPGCGAICRTLGQVVRLYGLRVLHVDDINADGFVQQLADMNIELGVSVRCYQKFGPGIISYFSSKRPPRLWNLHPGILPQYRGVMTIAYAMANRDAYTSYSLHVVNGAWDAGELIDIRPSPLASDRSVLEVYCGLAPYGGAILVDNILDALGGGLVRTTPQDETQARYYPVPNDTTLAALREKSVVLVNPARIARLAADLFAVPGSAHARQLEASVERELKACINAAG